MKYVIVANYLMYPVYLTEADQGHGNWTIHLGKAALFDGPSQADIVRRGIFLDAKVVSYDEAEYDEILMRVD